MSTDPLAEPAPSDPEDCALVARANGGDRNALEGLVRRHQAWIHNIAVRMLYHPHDAEDATQEILIKALTRLSSFEGRSSFRTWLYRIVVNHVLNMKRGRVEHASTDFASYGAALDDTPAFELADPKGTSADTDLLVTEAMISCTSGMLLCLDRARQDLRNFMNDKCGLVNQANPCRCAKKTRGFIQAGHVDPENLLFVRERICEVREAAPKTYETIKTLDDKCAEIYRRHPYYQ